MEGLEWEQREQEVEEPVVVGRLEASALAPPHERSQDEVQRIQLLVVVVKVTVL